MVSKWVQDFYIEFYFEKKYFSLLQTCFLHVLRPKSYFHKEIYSGHLTQNKDFFLETLETFFQRFPRNFGDIFSKIPQRGFLFIFFLLGPSLRVLRLIVNKME